MSAVQPEKPTNHDCEAIHLLIPAYSIGATDPEETQLVEAHLKNCPKAAAQLREYRVLADQMLYSVPLAQAPAHLHDQLMAEIQSTVRDPVPEESSFPLRGFAATVKRAFSPMLRQGVLLPASLVALLLLGTNLYWFNQMSTLQHTQDQMNMQLEDHNTVLALLADDKVQRIELQGVQDMNSRAVMLCNPEENVGFVYSENLPSLPSGSVYQVWLIGEDQQPMSSGVLRVNDQGDGTLVIRSSEPLGDFDAVEITRETDSGSLKPSSAPVMQGTLPYPNADIP